MKLTCNNPRIKEIELTNNLTHLTYLVDGKPVWVDGEFDFITNKDKEYIGIREYACVRRPECYNADGTLNDKVNDYDDGGVIEEIPFEAYFVD